MKNVHWGTLLSKERRVGYSDHLSILLKMFMFSNMAIPYDRICLPVDSIISITGQATEL